MGNGCLGRIPAIVEGVFHYDFTLIFILKKIYDIFCYSSFSKRFNQFDIGHINFNKGEKEY
jgi:hypothetical protein